MGFLGLGLGLGFLLLLLNPLPISAQEISVSVPHTDLKTISSNILAAESWLKANVLAHYPTTNITTILIAKGLPCNTHTHQWVSHSTKNLHHSLVRWGLDMEIKISTSNCYSINRKLFQYADAPDGYISFAPDGSPFVLPANPPEAMVAPSPANVGFGVPAPCSAPGGGMWCVAKPAVPDEKLKEAMDYACGEGRADCDEIQPNGKCYFPDNLVAHASYALNSYWQKAKSVGGSCSFDGAALLITSDPSFLQCQFLLS